MYVVKQPFSTPTRRFAVGAEVSCGDLAGPVPVSRWLSKKFIEALPPPEAVKPPKGQKVLPHETPVEPAA
ncbi:hypothetical protein [Niveispirillum cyanobacteriorum]|uniref:Uncharacterized protein n=1 Tax=Niveispirillum cyanobacteriorum TaxID=1612173 RepID=A0A2K9NFS4_9PROT|nr:hypothetical protein [Niveispirillum cyanobacteriorum]AUN31948.1 hypothetical protein C0V82_16085 [Niveispirillum cyanobacteriorum]GGE85507.1 hypothetical protein GCM10011317_48380 [Niveispirillum cyanobacteriorum]